MRVEIVPDAAWAEETAAALNERLTRSPGLRVCLATGRTPGPVYDRLAGIHSRATVFLLDEFGGLPKGHPGRCDEMIRRQLLDRVGAGPTAVLALDPMRRISRPSVPASRPSSTKGGLDLTVLGLGMNGHLGLNEPGTTADAPTRVVRLADQTRAAAARYGIDPPPTWGMTLGMASIMTAREVWLLVTGGPKAEPLARLLSGPVGAEFPASFLAHHRNAVILADESARSR